MAAILWISSALKRRVPLISGILRNKEKVSCSAPAPAPRAVPAVHGSGITGLTFPLSKQQGECLVALDLVAFSTMGTSRALERPWCGRLLSALNDQLWPVSSTVKRKGWLAAAPMVTSCSFPAEQKGFWEKQEITPSVHTREMLQCAPSISGQGWKAHPLPRCLFSIWMHCYHTSPRPMVTVSAHLSQKSTLQHKAQNISPEINNFLIVYCPFADFSYIE